MRLKNLQLNHYRNYTDLALDCAPGLNVFIGDNGQGKSNLLEAIYFLGFGRSYRLAPDDQVLQWDRSSFLIRGSIEEAETQSTLDIYYAREQRKKQIRLNGDLFSRQVDLIRYFPVVIFTPDDLQLVKGGPQHRRFYLDSMLSRVYVEYGEALSRYQKILQQRNHFLREKSFQHNLELITVLDTELAEQGAILLTYRLRFLPTLGTQLRQSHLSIAGEEEKLSFAYVCSAIPNLHQRGFADYSQEEQQKDLANSLRSALEKNRHYDYQRRFTTIGPHRDDVIFRLKNQNIRQYGSQGQQRSLVLALRLSELGIFEHYCATQPLLLLDDVLSELDMRRCSALLRLFHMGRQVFITSTSVDHLPPDLLQKGAIWSVQQGNIFVNK